MGQSWKAELASVEGKKGEVESDLVPKYLVINRYFAHEKQALDELQAKLEDISRESAELIEEHSGEEGYFADFDKINKASVSSRIKEIKNTPEDAEELEVLKKYLALSEQESATKKKIKGVEKVLEEHVIAKYKTFTESAIKDLVVDDKWMASLEQVVKGEMDRISQRLAQRIKELATRYVTPLPQLVTETDELTKKVTDHLKKMGFET